MRRLFPTRAERQEEIERIVIGHDPSFAYATLAQLLAHESFGPRCNIVLTTNFDDLVADALYLYTRVRPLVVTHEALVSYAAVGRKRATVIKLHGDALLDPKNTEDEVVELAPELVEALRRHVHSRALIFIGYGGNDSGVLQALSSLPPDSITHGIYWVNSTIPDNEFGNWLRDRTETLHVRHLDFDELMAVVKVRFDLPDPDAQRFTHLTTRYLETFAELQTKVRATTLPESLVARSVEEVRRRFGTWHAVELEARKHKRSDPAAAMAVYEEGIAEFPDAAPLLRDFAGLLYDSRRDSDRAESLFQRSLELDPQSSIAHSSYAQFLRWVRGDLANAEYHLLRALDIDSNSSWLLATYGLFLWEVHQDASRAADYLERSVELPNASATAFASMAMFVRVAQDDSARAEALHRRAIDLGPDDPYVCASFGSFMLAVHGGLADAEDLYRRAIAAKPNHAMSLGNLAQILFASDRDEEAVELVDRALAVTGSQMDLWLELNFYLYAHVPHRAASALLAIRRTIERGLRANWSFDLNLERARRLGDPRLEFLRALAEAVCGQRDVRSMSNFAEWRQSDEDPHGS